MTSYNSLKSLFNNTSKDKIIEDGIVVLRRENINKKNEFLTFADWQSAMKYVLSVDKKNRHFHEVIFGDQPQKLKFDIDIKMISKDVDDGSIEQIFVAIQNTFYTLYGIDLGDNNNINNFVVTTSSRPDKTSYHIIIDNFFVRNHVEAKYFTKLLLSILPKEIVDNNIIDPDVNKSTQNFRLVNCVKKDCGIESIKKILSPGKKWYNTLITFIEEDAMELPERAASLQADIKFSESIAAETADKNIDVENLVIYLSKNGWIDGCKFDKIVNDKLLLFKRFKAGKCRFCRKEHENDNSPMVIICPDGTILFKCRRNMNKKAKVLLSTAALKTKEDNINQLKRVITADSREAAALPSDISKAAGFDIGFNTVIDNVEIYNEPQLHPFIKTNTLFVRAAMKMGKTKALINYLNNIDPADKVIILSFRQTFSSAIKSSLKTGGHSFDLYSDFRGEIDIDIRPRVILQVESFFRMQTSSRPDLLILDESESIIEQLESGLSKNSAYTWAVFEWMVKYSKRVICMDAHLSRRTSNVIKKIRDNIEDKYHYSINTYQNAKNDRYFLYPDKFVWMQKLFDLIRENKKIVLPISSLVDAEAIAAAASTTFPNKNITIFTSKTAASAKKAAFDNVHSAWAGLDLLIYTPTVSAGISFELEHFDYLFGYFINLSCPVETVIQMMGRVRNIKYKEYHIMINEDRKIFKPYTPEGIERQIMTARTALFNPSGESNIELPNEIPIKFDESGRLTLYKSSFYTMWLENEIIRNKSKAKFSDCFIRTIKQYGAEFIVVAAPAPNDIDFIIKCEEMAEMFGEQKIELRNSYSAFVGAAPDIDESEAAEISLKLQKSINSKYAENISDIEKASFKKFNIRKIFEIPESEPITAEFITKFDKRPIKEVWRNLNFIKDNPEEKIEKLRSYSVTNFNNRIVNSGENNLKNIDDIDINDNNIKSGKLELADATLGEIYDLRDRHLYQRHKLCIDILKEFGFKSPFDKKIIGESVIKNIINDRGQHLIDSCNNKSLYLPEGIPQPPSAKDNDKKILSFINEILNSIYGVKIKPRRHDPDLYELGRVSEVWNLLINKN